MLMLINFISTNVISPFTKAIGDVILHKSDFRVYEPQRGFSNARTSYYKSIAGYHAAKPKRIKTV